MNDFQRYLKDTDVGCQTCSYRDGNHCSQYGRTLECAFGTYEQLDECLDEDGIAQNGDSGD